jgi:hypothetical protein
VQAKPQASRDAAVRPVADEAPRSVVVNRSAGNEASAAAGFDPFEADEQLSDGDAAMPSSETAVAQQFDPFEQSEAEVPADETAPAEEPSVAEAFEEPTVQEDRPTAAEELEQAQQAIDRELMRREVESGAEQELAVPEPAVDDEDASPAVPEMEDELVVPPTDDESFDDDASTSEEEFEMDMQYGGQNEVQPELTPEQIEQRRQQIEQERIEHEKVCEELYDDVRADSIKNISLDIRLKGVAGEDYPFECTGRHPSFQPRSWAQTVYLWKASGLCHKPLYFEQVQLERYGHDWGPVLQPIMSGAHFFGTIPILPYKMGLQTPNECVYTLGYYRPGSCAPYMITQPGFTWRAAAFETAAVTGVSAAVP